MEHSFSYNMNVDVYILGIVGMSRFEDSYAATRLKIIKYNNLIYFQTLIISILSRRAVYVFKRFLGRVL